MNTTGNVKTGIERKAPGWLKVYFKNIFSATNVGDKVEALVFHESPGSGNLSAFSAGSGGRSLKADDKNISHPTNYYK